MSLRPMNPGWANLGRLPAPRAARDAEFMLALMAFGQRWDDYTEERFSPADIARNFFKVIG